HKRRQQRIHAQKPTNGINTPTKNQIRDTPVALNKAKRFRNGSHTRKSDGAPALRHNCWQLRHINGYPMIAPRTIAKASPLNSPFPGSDVSDGHRQFRCDDVGSAGFTSGSSFSAARTRGPSPWLLEDDGLGTSSPSRFRVASSKELIFTEAIPCA